MTPRSTGSLPRPVVVSPAHSLVRNRSSDSKLPAIYRESVSVVILSPFAISATNGPEHSEGAQGKLREESRFGCA
jgi:hypothetical protein